MAPPHARAAPALSHPRSMASDDTPLMLQWREVKARHPDALVFFRVGDFFELFNEDAVEGSKLLDLTLTSRNNGGSKAPLAGIPAHALENYLRRLVALGKRVAICDQVEDPALAKGLVRREVTEMVTPGAVFSDALLDARTQQLPGRRRGRRGGGGDAGARARRPDDGRADGAARWSGTSCQTCWASGSRRRCCCRAPGSCSPSPARTR